MTAPRIDLGLAAPVRLGRLMLQPAIRTIRRDDDAQDVVEPRVMQVLLALAGARGVIVRREELTERCWEGRVVGEDAINRVLSRLRRVAEGIGAGSFRIETVTRVGYRLVELDAPEASIVEPPAVMQPDAPFHPDRRTVLIGAATAGGLAMAGAGIWWRWHRSALSAPARAAMERGMAAFRLMALDQLSTAASAFHEATELAPDAAEPWGRLALVYRWLYQMNHGQEARLNAGRARDAAGKALRRDPDNGDALATLATLQPQFRNWLAYDRACKPVLARHPDGIGIGLLYIDLLSNTGQIGTLNALVQRLIARDAAWPMLHSDLALSNWCLGRLDDADAAIEHAFQQWPRNIGVWFTRSRLLAYSGRAAAALAMVEDVDHRPTGLPEWDFDLSVLEARALLTRASTDIAGATAMYRQRARSSVGVATNAVQFFAAIGQFDDAFAILNALYFNRGFDVGERYYTEEQGTYSERRNRPTWVFWLPFMADLRADPRAGTLLHDVGLIDYWRASGRPPDFPVAGL